LAVISTVIRTDVAGVLKELADVMAGLSWEPFSGTETATPETPPSRGKDSASGDSEAPMG
jgi:hypothetical protein